MIGTPFIKSEIIRVVSLSAFRISLNCYLILFTDQENTRSDEEKLDDICCLVFSWGGVGTPKILKRKADGYSRTWVGA